MNRLVSVCKAISRKTSAKQLTLAVMLGVLFHYGAHSVFAQTTVIFNFDNIEGLSFTDNSGYGLRGEIVSGDLTIPESIPGVSGQDGDRAIAFDGRGSLVADDSEHFIMDVFPPLTLEVWARSSNPDQANIAWISYGFNDRADQVSGGYRLGAVGGNLVFTLYGVVDVQSEVAFPFDGEWHHVAAVYDYNNGVVRFYLDGEERQVIEQDSDMRLPDRTEVSFGAVSPGFLRYEGAIDRARISEDALSADDLDSDPVNIRPVADSTVAYFSFDETNHQYASQGARQSIVAVPVAHRIAGGVQYERIPQAAEIVTDTPTGEPWDRAIKFSGREFALVVDPDGILEFPADWTLEAWIKPGFVPDRSNAMVLYAYGAPGGGHSLQLAYSAADPTRLNVRGTAVGILDVPAPNTFVVYDEWQHVAVAHRNGESMTFFLNGEESEVIEYTQGMNPRNNEFLYIGTWPNALPFAYVGTLDRIRFSDRALSTDELDSDPDVITAARDWFLY